MAKVLKEYFKQVRCSDAFDYGYAPVRDFLDVPYETNAVDWVITNPPFRLAEEFIARSLLVARRGVAILARTVFLESVGRYQRLFEHSPPDIFAQFVERVPMVKGRLDAKASTAGRICSINARVAQGGVGKSSGLSAGSTLCAITACEVFCIGAAPLELRSIYKPHSRESHICRLKYLVLNCVTKDSV